jgi:hypothetical protein
MNDIKLAKLVGNEFIRSLNFTCFEPIIDERIFLAGTKPTSSEQDYARSCHELLFGSSSHLDIVRSLTSTSLESQNPGKPAETRHYAEPKRQTLTDCGSVNQFCIEDEFFVLIFHQFGKSEQGRYARDTYLGLWYYRHLIQHPGKRFRPKELYDQLSRKAIAVRSSAIAEAEVNAVNGSSVPEDNFDAAIDKEGIRAIGKKIQEIADEIDERNQEGDFEKVQELEAERERIVTLVSKDFRGGIKLDRTNLSIQRLSGQVKNTNCQSKKTTDSVRNAMKHAKTRIAKNMPMLSQHLREKALFKDGGWTYHPTHPSLDWSI